MCDELFHLENKLFLAPKGASADSFFRDMTKPALYLVEPGEVGGCVVHDESRMVCQPPPHLGVFMSAAVVCNYMHIQFSKDSLVDLGFFWSEQPTHGRSVTPKPPKWQDSRIIPVID